MKDRFWQVVYSFVPAIRAFFATVADRVLLAMKKPAAKVVVAVIAALFIVAFLTQGAFAVTENPDGSVTFTAQEAHSVGAYIRHQQAVIEQLQAELKQEKSKQCL